jgi:hypothetical protein
MDELEIVVLSGPAEEDTVSKALEVNKSSLVEDGVPWDSIFEVVEVSKSSPELVEVETGSTDDEVISGSADELEIVVLCSVDELEAVVSASTGDEVELASATRLLVAVSIDELETVALSDSTEVGTLMSGTTDDVTSG